MKIVEFAEVTKVIWHLWPPRAAGGRPDLEVGPGGTLDPRAELFLTARWATVKDLPAEDVIAAVLSLAETSTFEPSMSEIREAALGRTGGWADAWRRLNHAIDAYKAAPPVEVAFVEVDDDVYERVMPDGFEPNAWRGVAGDDVATVVDQMGGIQLAAESIGDAAFRAHFRDLWTGVADIPDLNSGRRAAAAIGTAWGGKLAEQVGVLHQAVSAARALPSGE